MSIRDKDKDKGKNAPEASDAAGVDMPTVEQLKAELENAGYKRSFFRVFRNSIFVLIVVAAVAALLAMLLVPVIQIKGDSMSDTLHDKDIVVAFNTSKCRTGDIIAFYYNNKILVKRVIASTGQWVDIDEDGNVYVDGEKLDEPYISGKAKGECNITLPYQVPDGRLFVMGDHRNISIDSRNAAVGCVSDEMIIGKIFFRVWPFDVFGSL